MGKNESQSGDYQKYMEQYAGDYQKYMKQGGQGKAESQNGDYQQYMKQYAGDYQKYTKQGGHDNSDLQGDRYAAQGSSKSSVSVSTRSEFASAHADASMATPAAEEVASISLAGRSAMSMSPAVFMSFAVLAVGFAVIVGKRRKLATPNGYVHLLEEP